MVDGKASDHYYYDNETNQDVSQNSNSNLNDTNVNNELIPDSASYTQEQTVNGLNSKGSCSLNVVPKCNEDLKNKNKLTKLVNSLTLAPMRSKLNTTHTPKQNSFDHDFEIL